MFEPKPPSLRERLILRIGGYSELMYWYRSLRPRWLWRLTSPFGRPTTKYVKTNGFEVKRGAFEGLKYPAKALGHTNYLSSKLMGVYEPQVVSFPGANMPRRPRSSSTSGRATVSSASV